VIESCLHRIPGLSENFLYLNDDVFLAKPLAKSFFFDASGASHSFLETYGMVSGDVSTGDPDYLNASRNVAGILRNELGFTPTQLHQHTAFALRQSVLAEIEERWAGSFAKLRKNKFRTPGDRYVVHQRGRVGRTSIRLAPRRASLPRGTVPDASALGKGWIG